MGQTGERRESVCFATIPNAQETARRVPVHGGGIVNLGQGLSEGGIHPAGRAGGHRGAPGLAESSRADYAASGGGD